MNNGTKSLLIPTDISAMLQEIKEAYQAYVVKFRIPDDHVIVVNFSGGKDSTATLAIANHLFGDRVRAVMADTDNEHEYTIEFASKIHEHIGGRPVQIVKKIYTQNDFDKRRASIQKNWVKRQAIRMGAYRGVIMPSLAATDTKFAEAWRKSAARWGINFDSPLDAALSVLKPSGNSFLDAALLHGKFPMLRDRFCTDELKIQVAYDQAIQPLLNDGEVVVQWSGVRGDESSKRAGYARFESDKRDSSFLYNFLPIHKWTATEVFALHKYFGIKPNPLYMEGAARVGCMNCVLCNKEEIAQTAARYPQHIEKHKEWEEKVRLVSRWVHWMSVGTVDQKWVSSMAGVREITDREGKTVKVKNNLGITPKLYGLIPQVQNLDWSAFYGTRGGMGAPSVDEVVEWARTGRGGKVFDLVKASIDTEVCSSRYGLCE